MDDKKRKQIFAGLVIIGISSLIAGGILPLFINTTNLGTVAILDTQNPSIVDDCHATIFSIGYGQNCYVSFSNTLEGNPLNAITVDLVFIRYEDYLYYLDAGTNPDSVSTILFTQIILRYPQDALITHPSKLNDIVEGITYNLEFAGDGSGSILYSRPGTYVLLVWAESLGTAPSALLGLSVNVEGIGDIINTICAWIGWIALAAAAILALAYFISKRKR
jgi:hypothetical protein